MAMRVYEYQCRRCGAVTEDLRDSGARDDPGPECEACDESEPTTYVVSAGRRQNYRLGAAWKSRNTNFTEI